MKFSKKVILSNYCYDLFSTIPKTWETGKNRTLVITFKCGLIVDTSEMKDCLKYSLKATTIMSDRPSDEIILAHAIHDHAYNALLI